MTLLKSVPQCPSLPSPLDERLILLKALCSLFATLIPKFPSVMSLDTDTHGPFICGDSGQNEKGRKLEQNSLIIIGQALEFQPDPVQGLALKALRQTTSNIISGNTVMWLQNPI